MRSIVFILVVSVLSDIAALTEAVPDMPRDGGTSLFWQVHRKLADVYVGKVAIPSVTEEDGSPFLWQSLFDVKTKRELQIKSHLRNNKYADKSSKKSPRNLKKVDLIETNRVAAKAALDAANTADKRAMEANDTAKAAKESAFAADTKADTALKAANAADEDATTASGKADKALEAVYAADKRAVAADENGITAGEKGRKSSKCRR